VSTAIASENTDNGPTVRTPELQSTVPSSESSSTSWIHPQTQPGAPRTIQDETQLPQFGATEFTFSYPPASTDLETPMARPESEQLPRTPKVAQHTNPSDATNTKKRRVHLLDITNSNARRDGTNKRVFKESARQKAARETS